MHAFSQEHQMVRGLVRKWAQSKLEPRVEALEAGEPPYELMRDFAKTFQIPELVRSAFERIEAKARDGATREGGPREDDRPARLGGLGSGDPAIGAAVSLELNRVCPGFALAFGASTALAGGAVRTNGTLEQKKRWGVPLMTLDKIGAWGMTEPGAGSDAFRGMRTMAVPRGN